MALREEPASLYPEQARVRHRQAEVHRSMGRAALGVAGIMAGAIALWALTRRR
jgi:hypothetical protein